MFAAVPGAKLAAKKWSRARHCLALND